MAIVVKLVATLLTLSAFGCGLPCWRVPSHVDVGRKGPICDHQQMDLNSGPRGASNQHGAGVV